MTVAELFIKYLKQLGVRHVFSIPGAALEPLYKAVHKSNQGETEDGKLRIILTKHEQGAAFMADGYARVGGKLGVCWGTTGPGSTNLITGIASSFADSIPVLVMTAQVSTSSFGKGALQESTAHGVNIVDLFRYFTKSSAMVINPEKAGDMFRQTLRHALSGRRGPAHLNIPVDLMEKEAGGKSHPAVSFQPQSKSFDREALETAAELLRNARNPAMLLGNGTLLSGAAAEAAGLTGILPLPVATTPKAKGAFPEDHPLSLGVFGLAGSPRASDYLLNSGASASKVDVLLAVGTSFNEWGTYAWDDRLSPGKALIQVDIDPYEFGKNYLFEVGLAGDAKAILQALALELRNQLNLLPKKERDAFEKKKSRHRGGRGISHERNGDSHRGQLQKAGGLDSGK
ncbi:MAG: thiamine pyrophosphate-binding protein [Nitrospinae bacterium]|nr:thiamine pyrophosphate-binding protein [Nitrospinota bacterium]